MNAPLEPAPGPSHDATSTGLTPQVSSLLCYLAGFVSGILFLLLEKENREVRFHAFQSLATFLSLFVASIVVKVVPLVGTLIAVLLTPLGLVLWVLLMVKAAQGEHFKLPWVGDWAEEQAQIQP